jgi:DNA-binding NtrC family response regulator
MGQRSAFPVEIESLAVVASKRIKKTILMADDELAVRQLGTMILERSGYAVVGAEDGETVLRKYAAEWARIDLVVLDLKMPGPGVEATIAGLRKTNPAARILLTSGCVPPDAAVLSAGPVSGFLGKPYCCEDLLSAVAAALEGS